MKQFLSHRIVLGAYIVLLIAVGQGAAQKPESGNVKTTITKVGLFSNPTVTVPYAGATLSRNNEGAFGTISTSSIQIGHVVTLWWAIFNNPQYCAALACVPSDLNNPLVNGSLQFGGGEIVGYNGRADFSGYLAEGDNTGYFRLPMFPNMPDPAPGIVDAKTAQIHFVIRDHGPASTDAAILQQQLNSFGGGCSTSNPCANIQAAIFHP